MVHLVDTNTRVLARLHPQKHNRGLNIYNPYLDEVGANAAYLLFQGPNPIKLIDGVLALGIAGAVIAGSFETDHRVLDRMDFLDPVATRTGAVGITSVRDGRLIGLYQGGFGILGAMRQIRHNLSETSITIVGAGTLVRGFLSVLELQAQAPCEITLYNRSTRRAELLAQDFPQVTTIRPLRELQAIDHGDVLINATDIGAPWDAGSTFEFGPALVARFSAVVDVHFVPPVTKLVDTARRLGKPVATGQDTYLHQVKFVLRETLSLEMLEPIFRRHMVSEFDRNWT